MIEVAKNEGEVEITDPESLFTDLGFSEPKSNALKMKADLYCRIVAAVRAVGYTQHAVSKILDIPQPRVSNIMLGKIDSMSIEALLEYAHHLDSSLRVNRCRMQVRAVARIAAKIHYIHRAGLLDVLQKT